MINLELQRRIEEAKRRANGHWMSLLERLSVDRRFLVNATSRARDVEARIGFSSPTNTVTAITSVVAAGLATGSLCWNCVSAGSCG